ncbi:MAG: hypothetical protein H6Q03_2168 [Acidobacteria bacterium]|nr:hypothetical protein [Acidobacteriota bacterium]
MPEPPGTEPARPWGGRSGRWLWGATGLGLVALVVSAGFWDPATRPGPTFCLFKRLTGVSCPACGLTRAAALAARGQWRESFAAHPLLPALALAAGAGWLLWGERAWRGRRRPTGAIPAVAAGLALAFVLAWLARWLAGTLPP